MLGLAQMSNVVAEVGARAVAESTNKTEAAGSHQNTWLVFRVAETARMAIPLSSVSRLEEIPVNTVERSGANEVVQYRGQIMPLIRVSAALGCAAASTAAEMLQVIVYTEKGRHIGLVVDEIVDIVEQQIQPEQCGRHAGVRNSAVIQQRVTDILDLDAVIAQSGFRPALATAAYGG